MSYFVETSCSRFPPLSCLFSHGLQGRRREWVASNSMLAAAWRNRIIRSSPFQIQKNAKCHDDFLLQLQDIWFQHDLCFLETIIMMQFAKTQQQQQLSCHCWHSLLCFWQLHCPQFRLHNIISMSNNNLPSNLTGHASDSIRLLQINDNVFFQVF